MRGYAGWIILSLSPYCRLKNKLLNSVTMQFLDLMQLFQALLNLNCTFVNCQDTHRNLRSN
jgi:hypothetical protein